MGVIALPKFKKALRGVSTLAAYESSDSDPASFRKFWLDRTGEHAYLEDVLGDKALSWVRKENERSVKLLGNPENSAVYDRVLGILDSKDKIPYVTKVGDFYYNFWRDATYKRGLFRRTTLISYKSDQPAWQTVLNLDELGEKEGENWVWKGYNVFTPEDCETEKPSRVLLYLSRGGADATVVREFDIQKLEFVEDGFKLEEAKSRVSWVTKDILLVGTDMQDGKSMTDSGYPRVVREWHRGQDIKDSKVVFEGENSDVSVSSFVRKHRGYKVQCRDRSLTFYTSKQYAKLLPGCEVSVRSGASSPLRTSPTGKRRTSSLADTPAAKVFQGFPPEVSG